MRRSLMAALLLLVLLPACAHAPEVTEPTQPVTEPVVVQPQPITENELGTIDGYDYELWKDYGDTQMLLQGGGAFRCDWKEINNALFRIGRKFDCTRSWQEQGLELGKLYEVAMTVEGYQSSGTAIVHRNEISVEKPTKKKSQGAFYHAPWFFQWILSRRLL